MHEGFRNISHPRQELEHTNQEHFISSLLSLTKNWSIPLSYTVHNTSSYDLCLIETPASTVTCVTQDILFFIINFFF